MLQLTIPISPEGWDEVKEEFIEPVTKTIRLEHSLVSLSKWESKWHKPFLTNDKHSYEETLDYIRCMTITQNVDPDVYNHIDDDLIRQVDAYINDPMTATTFPKDDKPTSPAIEITTSELIYYWMSSFNIPIECQTWHLNRLMTFIRICEVKNAPKKKRSIHDIMSRNKARNEANKKFFKSKG